MTALKYYGSTSSFSQVRPGVILKSPIQVWKESPNYQELTTEFAHNFLVERQIFDRLGDHPRIVRYLGYQDTMSMQQGLLLAEASHGNLQQYIDENNSFISLSLRKKWCRQTAESIAYLHSRGVIHSDLRPDNFLIHATSTASLDIWLCDFGGSTCEELGLDGGHLPDAGFFDPTQGHVSTPSTDIFSLGSILYTILTGHWPYKSPGLFKTAEERDQYDQKVDLLFRQRNFPGLRGLVGGKVILCCWMKKYTTAEEILCALELEMPMDDDDDDDDDEKRESSSVLRL